MTLHESAVRDSLDGLDATDVFFESGVFIPDLLVVRDSAKIGSRGIEGAPDLVVEILSPTPTASPLNFPIVRYLFRPLCPAQTTSAAGRRTRNLCA